MSAISGGKKPKPAVASARAAEPAYAIPTVKFDPNRVTEAVKADLKINIKEVKEFDESHFDQIYDAALRSISRGREPSLSNNDHESVRRRARRAQLGRQDAISLPAFTAYYFNKLPILIGRNAP